MTVLLFGGLIWWITGKPGWQDLKALLPEQRTEKPASSTGRSSSSSTSSGKTGAVIDKYKGVAVHYNGAVRTVKGRNVTSDGYNLGLRYQCVEFAKRFYYEAYGHKMPDSYGHAKDFYDPRVAQGTVNPARDMLQYKNGGSHRPQKDDLIVIGPQDFNPYGHLVVVTKASASEVSFVQQNPGPQNPSRGTWRLEQRGGGWHVSGSGVLGWLRMK